MKKDSFIIYTQDIEANFQQYESYEDSFLTLFSDEQVLPLFRQFGDGLKLALAKSGYSGSHKKSEMIHYILVKFEEIGASITRQTLYRWFNHKRPAHNSRDLMYQFCFAMNYDLETTKWFFEHVYYDRCFHMKHLKECIYYYVLLTKQSYQKALELYEHAKQLLHIKQDSETYTKDLRQSLEYICDDQSFYTWIVLHQDDFSNYNVNARTILMQLLKRVQGSNHQAKVVALARKKQIIPSELQAECGLAILDYISMEELQEGTQHYRSLEFMLRTITQISAEKMKEVKKQANQQMVLLGRNFVDKEVLGEVVKHPDTCSYESIRKVIILLAFYQKCVQDQFHQHYYENLQEQYHAIVSSIDYALMEADFNLLYPGNPHDWLYLHCARLTDPLSWYRYFYQDYMNESYE